MFQNLPVPASEPLREEVADTETATEELPGGNVILIIIDTLRADHLSCYGYHRYTSPSIDSLTESGSLWTSFAAQSPWTLPSHASIWTGLSVRSHRTSLITMEQMTDDESKNFALDPALPTLPELMSQGGYRTFGLANVCLLRDIYGFDRGFQQYSVHNAGHGRAEVSVDSLVHWLQLNGDDDFFCMLHLYDVHGPYDPPGQYGRLFQADPRSDVSCWITEDDAVQNPDDLEHLVSRYDGEIAWVDYNLEHGWVDHSHTLYSEVIFVPQILSGPGNPPGTVNSSNVGQFDILPTILAWNLSVLPLNVLWWAVPLSMAEVYGAVLITRFLSRKSSQSRLRG